MSDIFSNNKRIAKNTVFLYFRLFFNIFIQLYTIPIVLSTFGVSDYGLYNVVCGITAMFTFVGGSMASGVQRFFAFAIGEKDEVKLKNTFETTITIFICLAVVAFVLFEIIGLWFLNTQMVIEDGRISAANWIYQFSIISFVIVLITIPYNGVVIAHERMDFFAYVSIGSSLLKLLSIIILPYISFDYLIVYGLMMLIVQLLERIICQIFCSKKFWECRQVSLKYNKNLGIQLLTYSGFNLIGSIATILRKQGVNIVVNLFYGTIINAAHSIALHINGVLEQFISNLYIASRPQITKYYAEGKLEDMWKLTYRTSLLAYYLLMLIGIVAFIEAPTILTLWLDEYPDYTIGIIRVFIACTMIETTINQLSGVFQAYNRIKKWQMYASSILLLNVPIAYILLKIDSSNALYPYYIQLLFSLVYVCAVLIIARNEIHLDLLYYLTRIIGREIIVTIGVCSVLYLLIAYIQPSIFRVIITCIVTMAVSTIFVLSIGFNRSDRTVVMNMLKSKIIKSK